ncbi:hypothetical protein F3Y22_tig00004046pilonHSYRG00099 [Hibiscus syriacus]|uniref:Uncharacterized protein n=1 Tax=Hibiscus syriacus TaxID=106335 RepID=A0A6A3CNG7_HIBSY|nr:hypothetical protein F3Y22_tig00004046pilonHSYRG00099 [Hibiscus syriacus]
MRSLNVLDRCKGTQVYALNSTGGGGDVGEKLFHQLQDHLSVNSNQPKSIHNYQASNVTLTFVNETLLPYSLPVANLLEPQIEPSPKFVDFIETLADVHLRIERCPPFEKSGKQPAVDVHSKVVLAAWLRYERREDELVGTNSMNCWGRNIECPKATLIAGYNPEFIYDPCNCSKTPRGEIEDEECSTSGGYGESKREKINFTLNSISVECMKAAELYTRTRRVDSLDPQIIMDLLSFSNRFCCDNLKSACDSYLASLNFLRELPNSMHVPNVMKYFCGPDAKERLALVGHASFLLYFFLSQIAMEEDMKANTTVMLLESLAECAMENWQKQLAYHQLGVVMPERKEYKDAQSWFETACESGHIY